MKYIISGTNRPGSRTRIISGIVQKIYLDLGEDVEIVDLAALPLEQLGGHQYGKDVPTVFAELLQKLLKSEGIIFVCPEYNGSVPGALKYFIDFWKYPDTFEHRPVCFVGLGGMFGGLRPVEHLQQIFGYRNAFQYPDRIFIMNVWKSLNGETLTDAMAMDLLKKQAMGFQQFTKAIIGAGLHANQIERPAK